MENNEWGGFEGLPGEVLFGDDLAAGTDGEHTGLRAHGPEVRTRAAGRRGGVSIAGSQ